jgi:putative endonuclease
VHVIAYQNSTGKKDFIYILSNTSRSTLYIGVTSVLDERIIDHKYGKGSKFTAKYNLNVLLYYEKHPNISEAI